MQPAGGGAPTQSASRMWRSSDGKTRIDLPQTSVISDPASQHTIVLDHLKKEASVIPMSPPGAASMPGAPGAPAAPAPPSVHVQDLGKSMIDGHEVEGKRFTMPTPATPPKPPMPAMPAMPAAKMPALKMAALKMPGLKMPGVKMPGAPEAPKAPGTPGAPKPPSVTEMWTSVKLKTPVLTKVTTPSGELTTYCKPTLTAEHPPSVFQIPAGYTIKPPNVKPPSVKPPAVKLPSVTPPKP